MTEPQRFIEECFKVYEKQGLYPPVNISGVKNSVISHFLEYFQQEFILDIQHIKEDEEATEKVESIFGMVEQSCLRFHTTEYLEDIWDGTNAKQCVQDEILALIDAYC